METLNKHQVRQTSELSKSQVWNSKRRYR